MATCQVGEIELSFNRFGNGDPVLLIAGLGMPALLWEKNVIPNLVEAGFEVIAFDNRGVPPSSSPPGPYSIADMRDDAIALLDQLDLGPIPVVGYSMGSSIGQELAIARPDLISKLVLVGTRARHTAWLRAILEGQIDLFAASPDTPVSFFVPFLMAQLLSPSQIRDDLVVEPILDELLAAPPWTDPGRTGQYRAYLDYEPGPEALSGIRHPTLVLAFEDDVLIPVKLGREVAEAIPDAKFEILDGQGHWGVLLGTDDFVSVVVEFLNG